MRKAVVAKPEYSAGIQLWYSYCPVIHAGNVDDGLGWIKEEMKKKGAKFSYFRSVPENDYYPHYIHNLQNLFRFGGCSPAIHVKADIRGTRLLGLQWLHEGGGMLARVGEGVHRMSDLRGKKIGMSRSLNTIKNDWWRVTEERGIELMLELNGMTRGDVQLVDFPYADDWYDKEEMLAPVEFASYLWLSRDHKKDLAFRPLETALEHGLIDACYTADPFVMAQEKSGTFKLIESLTNYPDWTLQVANCPYALTCTDDFADKHPDLVVAFMKGIIRVGRFCNANRLAAATILDRNRFYSDVGITHKWISDLDFVPNLSARNLKAIEIEKDWMQSHGYIQHDFDVHEWAAPEFAEEAARELVEEAFAEVTSERLGVNEATEPIKGSLEEAQRTACAGRGPREGSREEPRFSRSKV
jgi:ABC-type nitrate/sulfonate/bicarbonate transport system substrate-binding protein